MRKYGLKRKNKPKHNVTPASRNEVRQFLAEQAERNSAGAGINPVPEQVGPSDVVIDVDCACGYGTQIGKKCLMCGEIVIALVLRNARMLDARVMNAAEHAYYDYDGNIEDDTEGGGLAKLGYHVV